MSRHDREAGAGIQLLRVEGAALGGDRVGRRVIVGPGHRAAGGHVEARRNEGELDDPDDPEAVSPGTGVGIKRGVGLDRQHRAHALRGVAVHVALDLVDPGRQVGFDTKRLARMERPGLDLLRDRRPEPDPELSIFISKPWVIWPALWTTRVTGPGRMTSASRVIANSPKVTSSPSVLVSPRRPRRSSTSWSAWRRRGGRMSQMPSPPGAWPAWWLDGALVEHGGGRRRRTPPA